MNTPLCSQYHTHKKKSTTVTSRLYKIYFCVATASANERMEHVNKVSVSRHDVMSWIFFGVMLMLITVFLEN